MEVEFTPEVEERLQELSAASGRPAQAYVEEAMTTYLDGLADVRSLLASRYTDIVSGRVTPINGEEFFASLERREESMLRQLKRG